MLVLQSKLQVLDTVIIYSRTMFQSAAVAVATIVLISALPYGGARSIGEEQYGELLRARQQEAFHYHRTPEYDESNHFTAEEAQEMRAARRIKRSWLNTMETQLQAEEEVGGTKIQTESDSIDTNKQPTRQADEEDVNLCELKPCRTHAVT